MFKNGWQIPLQTIHVEEALVHDQRDEFLAVIYYVILNLKSGDHRQVLKLVEAEGTCPCQERSPVYCNHYRGALNSLF